MTRAILLSLFLSGCAAARQDPCAPLWGAAVAGSFVELAGAATTAQDVQDPTIRDTARVATIGVGLGTVVAVGEAARCESRK